MELAKHLGVDQILLSLDVKDKWELLDVMIESVLRSPVCERQSEEIREKIRSSVIQREKSMSTGVGQGYALPHARVDGFQGVALAVAVLKEPVEFDSIDGEPVRIVVMVVTPEDKPTIALKVMSALSSFMMDETSKYIFLHESDPKRLHEYLKEKKINFDISICAKDIMRKAFSKLGPSLPLRKATSVMFKERVEAIAVVDEEGCFIGEVTCDTLFKKGIPDFFNQLASVSFVRNYDPFEKYFENERETVVGEIAVSDAAVVNERTTIMEVVYLLSVKKHPKVYVLSDKKLVGTIDRTTVLDQVLNF